MVKPVLLRIVPVLKQRARPLLRGLWMRVRRGASPSGRYFKRVLSRIVRMLKERVWPLLRHPLLPIAIPVRNAQARKSRSWLKPKDLAIIRRTNANDAGCVSWILWKITDPEALDAGVRLAGTIRWFDDGTNADPPYDMIASTFEACFDPAGKLYPGSRDRAYYSGRAMVWIWVLAMHKPREFSRRFPLPRAKYEGPGLDPDLRSLLRINERDVQRYVEVVRLLATDREHTPSHAQWASDVLLNFSWCIPPSVIRMDVLDWFPDAQQTEITINLTLNRLLMWCIALDSPPMEEALEVQKKSYDNSYFVFF